MKRVFRLCAVNVVVFVSLLIIIEGIAGYAGAIRLAFVPYWATDSRHTQYDPELGWVNEPHVLLQAIYGPRGTLRINGQGFRNDHEFSKTVPTGRLRVICSGDSFTFGQGVDNNDTWCQQLTALDRRLETINMGQPGYGVDQAYLWYKRDGMAFEHQVQVLAFITDDFSRMESNEFAGRRKPVLAIDKGTLVVTDVPVPRSPGSLIRRFHEGVSSLQSLQVSNRVLRRFGLMAAEPPIPNGPARDETRQLTVKILEDLKRLHDARSSLLMLVYLPTVGELNDDSARPWREFMALQARALGMPMVDTFDAFEPLPARIASSLFIQDGEINDPTASGHLTVKGNTLVAQLVYDELKKHFLH